MEILARASLRIVHVEDNEDFAGISEIYLRRAGFEQPILRCKDGVEAQQYFSTIEPQQVLPNVMVPNSDPPNLPSIGFARRSSDRTQKRSSQ